MALGESPSVSLSGEHNAYLAAVPQDILDHPETDIESLKNYCRERGITFGERPSLSVLRAKLMSSNADLQTVWSMRMTTLAAAAMSEQLAGQDRLDQFQRACYHPPSVLPDGPRALVVAEEGQRPGQAQQAHGRVTPRSSTGLPTFVCTPTKSQFRRPPAPTVPLLGSTTGRTPPAPTTPRTSPAERGSEVTRDGEGDGMRESDRIYQQYCKAKRAEEERDLRERQERDHMEIKDLLVSLGQSMADVSGAVQAHAASATVTAQRHTDGLVSISREQAALRASLDKPPPSLSAARAPKRQKTTPISASLGLQPPGATAFAPTVTADVVSDHFEPTLKLDLLFSPIMEAELIEARLVSSPLALQLQRIVRLAHVSPGKPGLFGSYVVYGLYESAGIEAAAASSPGALSHNVNKEKQRRMKNIIANKADTYVRLLFWMRTIVPEVLETPAEEATVEKMEQFTMTKELCSKLQRGLQLEAHKAKYPPDHPILMPTKARMSTLRDMLHVLVVDHGYASNVEEMLRTPPFADRLLEASKRIRPRYHTTPPPPA